MKSDIEKHVDLFPESERDEMNLTIPAFKESYEEYLKEKNPKYKVNILIND